MVSFRELVVSARAEGVHQGRARGRPGSCVLRASGGGMSCTARPWIGAVGVGSGARLLSHRPLPLTSTGFGITGWHSHMPATGQTSLLDTLDLATQSTSLIKTGWGSQSYGPSRTATALLDLRPGGALCAFSVHRSQRVHQLPPF